LDLQNYLRVARKRWWMVAMAIAAALILAVIVTVRTTPLYATSVTFFITTPNTGVTDAYQGGLFSQQRVKSYATLLTGDRLAKTLAAGPGLALTAQQIRDEITAQAIPDTVLLQATVTDTSRARSVALANLIAIQFEALVESLETPPGRSSSSVKVEVVAGPETADQPVSPRPLRNYALAALIGLILGAGTAVSRELLDTTVKTAEVLQSLTGAPVLAGVPLDDETKSGPAALIAGGNSARAEALRQLRTNLQYVDVDNPVKTIVVTSAIPGEGKSSTSCALAALAAEAGNKVLLIDADLRRPRIAEYLDMEGAVGLTTVLVGEAALDDVLQRWGSRLWVLPSGFLPPNPSELLGSRQMAELLERLRETFDMIIVDCPPLLPVTDAAVVAARADGAVLLVKSHKTVTAQVTAAAAALSSVDARLIGCVLNMVAAKGPDAYYYTDAYSARTPAGRRRAPHATSTARRPAGADHEAAQWPPIGDDLPQSPVDVALNGRK
jgi:capsular exopolysaccharide synthesis family protein